MSLMAPYLRKFGCYTVPDFIGKVLTQTVSVLEMSAICARRACPGADK